MPIDKTLTQGWMFSNSKSNVAMNASLLILIKKNLIKTTQNISQQKGTIRQVNSKKSQSIQHSC